MCATHCVTRGGHARNALCAWRREGQRLIQGSSGSIAKMWRLLRRGAACTGVGTTRCVMAGFGATSWGAGGGVVSGTTRCVMAGFGAASWGAGGFGTARCATRCVRGGEKDNASSKWPHAGSIAKMRRLRGGRPAVRGWAQRVVSWQAPGQRLGAVGRVRHSALCHGGALCATPCVPCAVAGTTRCVMAGSGATSWGAGAGLAQRVVSWGGPCAQRPASWESLVRNSLCCGGGPVAQRVVSQGRACAQRVVSWERVCAQRVVSRGRICAQRVVSLQSLLRSASCHGGGPAHNALCRGSGFVRSASCHCRACCAARRVTGACL